MATQTRNPEVDGNVSGTWSGSAPNRYTLVDDHPDSGGADVLTHGTASAGRLTFSWTGGDLFTVPAGSTAISIQVIYYDYKNGSAGCTARSHLEIDSATDYFSATHNPGNGVANIALRTNDWATNPAGGAWTVEQVNGTAGSGAISGWGLGGVDVNPSISFASVIIQVTYTPGTTPLTFTGTSDLNAA